MLNASATAQFQSAAAPGAGPSQTRLARKPKLRVLAFTDYYLPGYKGGGPIRTLSNLVTQLGDAIEWSIVTRDRDLGDEAPYPNVVPGSWHEFGGARVYYGAGAFFSVGRLRELLRSVEFDILYLNSFFARRFSMLPLILMRLGLVPARPVVLAPRGEFSPGALGLKRVRKAVYVRLARAAGLYRGVHWHASTELELNDIRSWFGERAAISVAPNPSMAHDEAPPLRRTEKKAGTLRILFLSRVSRKKNLVGALQMLRDIVGRVELSVVGPFEDATYHAECAAAAASLPDNVSVVFQGPATHADALALLQESDLFFLPTLGENFGHVILESLLCGCPVLLSDQTPWRGLEDEGVGWDVPLKQPDRFRKVLQRCVDMGAREHGEWSVRAHAYALRYIAGKDASRLTCELFLRAAQATT
jgi:glycosyltransferase involved in cell wall biosynthesis